MSERKTVRIPKGLSAEGERNYLAALEKEWPDWPEEALRALDEARARVAELQTERDEAMAKATAIILDSERRDFDRAEKAEIRCAVLEGLIREGLSRIGPTGYVPSFGAPLTEKLRAALSNTQPSGLALSAEEVAKVREAIDFIFNDRDRFGPKGYALQAEALSILDRSEKL